MSVCTGARGATLLLDPIRFEVVGHAEIDKHASAVLNYRYPKVKNYGSITQKDFAKQLPHFDILEGGTPCQSFSLVGNQTGLAGKSGLFYNFVSILKERQPSYFVWENVVNATSVNNGLDFLIIQNELAQAGYSIQWQVLDATDFGVPQVRSRLFIVGYNRNSIPPNEIFYRSIKEKRDIESNGATRRRQATFPCANQRGQTLIAYSKSTRALHIDHRIRVDGTANTLTTGSGCSSRSSFTYVLDDGELRILTPLECERLMSWPDEWTKYGKDDDGDIYILPESQRYKICGNGIVSRVTKQLIERTFQ